LTKRKRLIYLFVKDMSSGVSGEELVSKAERDSQMSVSSRMDRVSWKVKWWSWIFVILLDGAMLLYIYLFAVNQTHSRQSAWFQSFVMWLFFEIFVSSTSLVLVMHLFLPLYVWTDVSKLKKKVLGDLIKFREKLSEKKKEVKGEKAKTEEEGAGQLVVERGDVKRKELPAPPEFNAAKYLYPSWRVASLFPELPESKLILQFSTPWPKKRFGEEVGNVAKEYEDDVILSAASQIILYFVTSLLHSSTLLQDILIQTVGNGGLGYLGVLLIRLWMVNPWLSVVTVLVGLLCLHFVFKMSSGGLSKKLSGGVGDKMIFPDDTQPEVSSDAAQFPSAGPVPNDEVRLGSWDSSDDEFISIENISVADSRNDDSDLQYFRNFFESQSNSSRSRSDDFDCRHALQDGSSVTL
jgi:hypothetical protein